VAPFNPFDPGAVRLMDAFTPPAWAGQGMGAYLLGTDDQGRDLLSTILYGSRISLLVGFSAIVFAAVFGTLLGVLCGYRGGWLDMVVMRAADVQLTIPSILIALMIDGIARTALPRELHNEIAIFVLIFAIGVADWPQFARVARSAALVERNKDYVAAARVIGQPDWVIVLRHVLPNTLGPVLVLATVGLALAVLSEATLSFLGVGVPPTQPSLGTLIRVGQSFLFSGEWWITFFPALTLVLLVLAVNVLGDWLRDALNPKLR
jgi:peptide/nickel transport system permease protein